MTGTSTTDSLKDHGTATVRKNTLGLCLSVHREPVLALLKELATDNAEYFSSYGVSAYAVRIKECCEEIASSSHMAKNLVKTLQEAAKLCDYDENTPGNGFRSLICVCDIVVLQLISVLRICCQSRNTMMFRIAHYCKEIESFGAVFRFLIISGRQVVSLVPLLEKDSLFPPLNGDYAPYNFVFKEIEALDASCFYGRSLGFQFSPSVTRIFRIIGFILATYSLSWENSSSALGSLLHSGKFLLNPEQRAVRIIKVTRESDLEFCRGFWNLSELAVPRWYCPSMALNEVREIPLVGPLPMEAQSGEMILIPEPCVHTGPRPVRIRVMSVSHREGLSAKNAANKQPASPYLVIHCHGGGYVATSSKSHETYLRLWAKELNCPLVSIDYSLSPENPFPRPTEEVLYTYAFIINSPHKFGWTGENVCMVGDSAGGNLVVSAALRLAELGAKRLPNGIVPVYTPFLFQYLPSPSRVLSFMDPLLHMGVVIRCAAAYTGVAEQPTLDAPMSSQSGTSSAVNGHKSLQEYVDQVQKAQKDNSYFDFNTGSQSIVSLVNLSQGKTAGVPSATSAAETIEEKLNEENSHIEKEPTTTEDSTDNEENEQYLTLQGVQINSDSSNICLSAVNYDETLISFLQTHPLTKSHVRNDEGEVKEGEEEPPAVQQSTNALNFIPKSATTNFISNLLSAGPPKTETGPASPEKVTVQKGSTSKGSSPTKPIRKNRLSRNKQRSLSQSLADTAALAAGHAYDNLAGWFETTTPLASKDKIKLNRTTGSTTSSEENVSTTPDINQHVVELIDLKLPRDPLISPMYASDEVLRKLPPVRFVACHLDPLLDDTIMFARRLRDVGGEVHSIDLIDSLPHGFLNFAPMSPDCRDGALLCLRRIKQILGYVE